VNNWSLSHTFALANCFSDEPMELVRCETDLGVQAEYGFLWRELGEVDGALPKPERMQRIAAMTTSPENGYFARTIVNRVWALLMGRGLVEPLDEMERAAWHPALLDALAADFVTHGYDLKHLLRTLMTSQAYGARSTLVTGSSHERSAEVFTFRGPEVRRITAEQFYDALGSLAGVWRPNPAFAWEEPSASVEGPATPERATTPAANARPVRAWRVPLDPLSKALGRTAREQVTTRRETVGTTLQAPTADRVIVLWMAGGMAHTDTFDPKRYPL
jgi:hypothetical protein